MKHSRLLLMCTVFVFSYAIWETYIIPRWKSWESQASTRQLPHTGDSSSKSARSSPDWNALFATMPPTAYPRIGAEFGAERAASRKWCQQHLIGKELIWHGTITSVDVKGNGPTDVTVSYQVGEGIPVYMGPANHDGRYPEYPWWFDGEPSFAHRAQDRHYDWYIVPLHLRLGPTPLCVTLNADFGRRQFVNLDKESLAELRRMKDQNVLVIAKIVGVRVYDECFYPSRDFTRGKRGQYATLIVDLSIEETFRFTSAGNATNTRVQ